MCVNSQLLLSKFNILTEKDDYEVCAGDAMRKCFIFGETKLEGQIDWLAENKKYTNCYKKEGKTCSAAILKHFIAYLNAYEKHLKGGQGEFGEMVQEIPIPATS